MLQLLTILVIIFACGTSARTTLTGSVFNAGSTSYRYDNHILQCNNGSDCTVSCSAAFSCRGTTVLCPESDNACTVSCSADSSCHYTDIHWIPGNTNTLSCSAPSTYCYWTRYPPSPSPITPLTVNCDSELECYGQVITCPDNAQCQVLCTGTSSCLNAFIICPSSAGCNIFCTGTSSCSYAVVIWSFESFALAASSLACPDGGDQCNFIRTPAIINPPHNNKTYNLICDGPKECASSVINCPEHGHCIITCLGDGSCAGSIMNCPLNADCSIICSNEYPEGYACRRATFNGPRNGIFSVLCNGQYACDGINVHAEDADFFYLTIPLYDSGGWVVQNSAIWFPPKQGNETRAQIYVGANNDFNGYYGYHPLSFYAIHGWSDVDIITDDDIWTFHGGTMHCGYNYTDSCLFASDGWRCNASNTICDDLYITTNEPSASPSRTPSESPSEVPSESPTEFPSRYPTSNPTIIPTEIPSTLPTALPTGNPSFMPSKNPTIEPSHYPTLSCDCNDSDVHHVINQFEEPQNQLQGQTDSNEKLYLVIIIVLVVIIVLMMIGFVILYKRKQPQMVYSHAQQQSSITGQQIEMQDNNKKSGIEEEGDILTNKQDEDSLDQLENVSKNDENEDMYIRNEENDNTQVGYKQENDDIIAAINQTHVQ